MALETNGTESTPILRPMSDSHPPQEQSHGTAGPRVVSAKGVVWLRCGDNVDEEMSTWPFDTKEEDEKEKGMEESKESKQEEKNKLGYFRVKTHKSN